MRPSIVTQYEWDAYKMLVSLQQTSASEIARLSGVPQGRIYSVLHSLENKGLVSVIPGNPKHFTPGDPEILNQAIKKQKNALSELQTEIQDLASNYENRSLQPVLVAQGKRNFYRLDKEFKSNSSLSYNIKYMGEPKAKFVNSTRRALKRGAERKDIINAKSECDSNAREWKELGVEVARLNNKGVSIGINDDEVLIGLINNNTTMLVRDSAFAHMMQQLFVRCFDTLKKE